MSYLESVFREMAQRVNTEELGEQLTVLLVIYNMDDDLITDVKKIVGENMLWLETFSEDIQDFLNDFLRSGSSATTFSCFVIVFGLALNWIMQN